MLKSAKSVSSKVAVSSVFNTKVRKEKQSVRKDASYTKLVPKIQKRDGTVVPFNFSKS